MDEQKTGRAIALVRPGAMAVARRVRRTRLIGDRLRARHALASFAGLLRGGVAIFGAALYRFATTV